jgi:hypothetical protein
MGGVTETQLKLLENGRRNGVTGEWRKLEEHYNFYVLL